MTLEERIHGCLLGGACGDALGAPVEFLTLDEIKSRYGAQGITQFDAAFGRVGTVTDDTQMTLFTVEGLLRAAVRSAQKGTCHPQGVVHHAYKRWFATQTERFEDARTHEDLDGWLIREERLWARRAPGNTCLSALGESRPFGTAAQNNSKGCGTVMRDSPFGLMFDPQRAFTLALETARTTHGHPSAGYASGALAAIIAFIVDGHDLPSAVQRVLGLLTADDADEVLEAIKRAVQLSEAPDWRERLPDLGEGWVAEEALGIAVLCALAGRDSREAIVAAVNHGGDSDSTGAITGNLVGALRGPLSLPQDWVEQVELMDVIETLSRDFAAAVENGFDPKEFSERYPGW